MVRTLSISTDMTADHKVQITLPDDVPVGPVELVIVVVSKGAAGGHTLRDLAGSEFFGMWRDRDDIGDSQEFARKLREEGWRRSA